MDTAKERIPKQCRIGDTCFISLATIGGYLFMIHPKKLNHIHKESNDLMSVIVILVIDVHGDKIMFYGMTTNDIWKTANFLKHSHKGCVVGAFDKSLHEGSIWTVH